MLSMQQNLSEIPVLLLVLKLNFAQGDVKSDPIIGFLDAAVLSARTGSFYIGRNEHGRNNIHHTSVLHRVSSTICCPLTCRQALLSGHTLNRFLTICRNLDESETPLQSDTGHVAEPVPQNFEIKLDWIWTPLPNVSHSAALGCSPDFSSSRPGLFSFDSFIQSVRVN